MERSLAVAMMAMMAKMEATEMVVMNMKEAIMTIHLLTWVLTMEEARIRHLAVDKIIRISHPTNHQRRKPKPRSSSWKNFSIKPIKAVLLMQTSPPSSST